MLLLLNVEEIRHLIKLNCSRLTSSSDTKPVNESNILCQFPERNTCAQVRLIRLTFSSPTYLLLSRLANYRRMGIFPWLGMQ